MVEAEILGASLFAAFGRMTNTPTLMPDDYLTLIRVFPLASIRDDAHLDEAIAIMNRLTTGRAVARRGHVSPGPGRPDRDLRERPRPYPPLSGVELLRFLIDEHGLQQKDLAPLFGTASIASEVLSGKRPLAFSHIKRLSQRFGLPVDAFIDT